MVYKCKKTVCGSVGLVLIIVLWFVLRPDPWLELWYVRESEVPTFSMNFKIDDLAIKNYVKDNVYFDLQMHAVEESKYGGRPPYSLSLMAFDYKNKLLEYHVRGLRVKNVSGLLVKDLQLTLNEHAIRPIHRLDGQWDYGKNYMWNSGFVFNIDPRKMDWLVVEVDLEVVYSNMEVKKYTVKCKFNAHVKRGLFQPLSA